MKVPRLLVLTDRRQAAAAGRGLPGTLERAAGAGAPAVLLRERDLPELERRELASELVERLGAHGTQLLVAGDAELAAAVGAHGVHLAAADPAPGDPAGCLVGRSCHDESELAAARAEAVDYVTASPVAPTGSKPGYGPPLGAAGLSRLVAAADGLPVLALGGVSAGNAATWRTAGAHGVAVMGAVMRAEDPAQVVEQLLAALREEGA